MPDSLHTWETALPLFPPGGIEERMFDALIRYRSGVPTTPEDALLLKAHATLADINREVRNVPRHHPASSDKRSDTSPDNNPETTSEALP
jgi:hypothetical protein